ncbi:MAG TPA: poly-beta-1,6-N-acetyl-D-glucosamine N-deacetylase PgaB, partial [Oceanospirillales bacterium]|nr:poly-beta-1,6-N-acetyl-D-glucosamine N-deacetylase PgaB [Oceanospirillales bacterium]
KPETLKIMTKLYADLAKHAKFAGILFHDDGILTDDEDVSPEALAYYKEHGITFNSASELLNNSLWSRLKTKALIEFTNKLRQQVYYYLPTIKTARNIYAQVIVNPESEQWFAQNLKEFVKNYDTTAIMAMPYMEQAKNPKKWLTQLADIINQSNLPKAKIIFELQAKNWHNKSKIVTKELIQQFQLLQQKGIMNYGYYPDDFLMNHPNFTEIFPEMSLTDFPYYKR